MHHLLTLLPGSLNPGGPTTTAGGAIDPRSAPDEALKRAGDAVLSSGQAIAGSWLLVVVFGLGAWYLFQRGRKLTALAGSLVGLFLGVMLIFNPAFVLDVLRGMGLKITQAKP